MEATEFSPGSEVVYGLHGRCSIVSIETKKMGGQELRFYKLQVQKNALTRSKQKDPAIWLPVDAAQRKGLRAPIQKSETDAVFEILSNGEYYFSLETPFKLVLPELESCVEKEGAIGLAKVVGFIYVLKKRLIVAPPEVNRFNEIVLKALTRELAEAFEDSMRAIEEKIEKALRNKEKPDN